MKKKSSSWKKIMLITFLAICSISKVQAQAALLVLIFGEKALLESREWKMESGEWKIK